MTFRTLFSGLILALPLLSGPACADDPPQPQRAILQQSVLPGDPGKQAVLVKVTLAPGAQSSVHVHHGLELAYVASGTVVLAIDGTTQHYSAGASFLIPQERPHQVTNDGAGDAELIVTWVVDTGKPLIDPAPTAPAHP